MLTTEVIRALSSDSKTLLNAVDELIKLHKPASDH
jgi:hypothetical protein